MFIRPFISILLYDGRHGYAVRHKSPDEIQSSILKSLRISSFPDSNGTLPSLYGLLSPTLTSSSTPAEIRSAYRRSALSCHPDKLPPTSTPADLSAASVKFAQIGFAYDVLKDEKRRERYDKTGETGEVVSMSEAEWKDYFKELWKGEVNAETLDEFKNKYQGEIRH